MLYDFNIIQYCQHYRILLILQNITVDGLIQWTDALLLSSLLYFILIKAGKLKQGFQNTYDTGC